MSIDPGSPETVYAQIARIIREEIIAGEIPLGGTVSERSLTQRFGISRSTAKQALDLLRAEGLIVTVYGFGSRVAAVPQVRQVTLHPGDRVAARMPRPSEREEMGLAPGIPLLVITRAGGGEEAYGAAAAVACCQVPDATLSRALGVGRARVLSVRFTAGSRRRGGVPRPRPARLRRRRRTGRAWRGSTSR